MKCAHASEIMYFPSRFHVLLTKCGSKSLLNSLPRLRNFSCTAKRDMKVVIGGGTGFVGKRLQKTLESKGHEVQVISRKRGVGKMTWDDIRSTGLPECQAVVNLAGELLLNPLRRWNNQLEDDIRNSRIQTTKLLAEKIAESPNPPEVFIGSSAVGFYPSSNDIKYTEDHPPSDADFLTKLCRDWEAAASLPSNCTTRQVTVRIGVVLGKEGGILQQTLWPFWLGLGGVVGSGSQPFPWIHIQDICDIITFAITNKHVTGVMNGVAPSLSTNKDFTRELASALCRPAFIPVPSFAVNAAFGTIRGSVILEGQKVVPHRTQELGYQFRYPDLKSALKDAIQ